MSHLQWNRAGARTPDRRDERKHSPIARGTTMRPEVITMWGSTKITMPTKDSALPGRAERMPVPAKHHVHDRPLTPPFPAGLQTALFGLGCFWGAEKAFWQTPGVFTTAVGYAGGFTPNATYE